MSALDIQIKQEVPDPDLDGQTSVKQDVKVTSSSSSRKSASPTPATYRKSLPFMNGLMAAGGATPRGVVGGPGGVQSPVLVVPQPFPHYVTYYRPNFQTTDQPAAGTGGALPYQALDLSKTNNTTPAGNRGASGASSPKDTGNGSESDSSLAVDGERRADGGYGEEGDAGEDGRGLGPMDEETRRKLEGKSGKGARF